MKNIIYISLLSSVFFLSATSFAETKSSDIQLGGGSIAPRATLKLALDKLTPLVFYKAVCHITDANNLKNQAYMKFSLPVNVNKTPNMLEQVKLTEIDNTVEIEWVTTMDKSIAFTNLDQEDTVVVDHCVATPMNW
jgi:hypothetical protein